VIFSNRLLPLPITVSSRVGIAHQSFGVFLITYTAVYVLVWNPIPVNVTTQPTKKLEHPGIVENHKPSFQEV
jgi:hypothetical protein